VVPIKPALAIIAAAFLAAGMAACSDTASDPQSSGQGQPGVAGGGGAEGSKPPKIDATAAAKAAAEKAAKTAKIVETGFGQNEEFTYAASIVKNKTDHGGQGVTVTFNLKDAAGKLIATESARQSFGWGGEEMAVGTVISVDKGAEVAEVEATLAVEEDAAFGADKPFGKFDVVAGAVEKAAGGGWEAKFKLKNPQAEAVESPRVGVVCWDDKGKINGGTAEYPASIPGGGEAVVAANVIVSGAPDTCKAYVGAFA
jgi:hypothetical protein